MRCNVDNARTSTFPTNLFYLFYLWIQTKQVREQDAYAANARGGVKTVQHPALLFSSGQTAVKLSGAEAADRAQCAAPD